MLKRCLTAVVTIHTAISADGQLHERLALVVRHACGLSLAACRRVVLS